MKNFGIILVLGLIAVVFLVGSILWFSGVGRQALAVQTIDGDASIPLGTQCTVQFRRDSLGTARDLPVSPVTDNINGAETSVSGRLVQIDANWVVLEHRFVVGSQVTDNYYDIWVPRDQVLLIRAVRPTGSRF